MAQAQLLQDILEPQEREKAVEVDRFLRNLFLLFDGDLPAKVQQHVLEILEVLEEQTREQFKDLLKSRKKLVTS